MKHFKSFLFMLALAFAVFPAFAQNTTVSDADQLYAAIPNMDLEQRAALLEQAKHIQNGTSAASTAKEWVDVGANLGQGLSATARELGVAVNDFSRSPVGKVAMALIVWKIAGSDIVHLLLAMLSLGLMFGWYRVFRRLYGNFDEKGKLIGMSMSNDYGKSRHGDGTAFLFQFIFPLALFITFLVSLATIG